MNSTTETRLVPDSTRDGFNTRNQDLNVARNEKRELALKAGEEARMALFRITLELGEEKEHYTAEEVATQCRLLKEYAVWKVKKAEADREAWALMTDDERGRYEEEEEEGRPHCDDCDAWSMTTAHRHYTPDGEHMYCDGCADRHEDEFVEDECDEE